MTDPLAIIRARLIRQRAARIKAALRAWHEAGPEEFVSHEPAPAPQRFVTWVTHAPGVSRRRHRASGKTAGGRPRSEDVGLGGAIYALMSTGMSKTDAITTITEFIANADSISKKSARERVYRALRDSG